MEGSATTETSKNNDGGDHDAVALVVQNAAKVQVSLHLIFLPVGMPYVGEPPSTRASTMPVTKIVGGQT